jgi:hypothetical protein
MYLPQYKAFKEIGVDVSTIDVDDIKGCKIFPKIQPGEKVLYRGWMLNEEKYKDLVNKIISLQAEPFTNTEAYLLAHHLPNWYPLIKKFTPKTIVVSLNTDLEYVLKNLGWSEFFIKDYVKSLKTSVGSLISKPEEIYAVVAEIKKYRGEIEGGVCIRQVEKFLPDTEKRYFVVLGKAFASDSEEAIPNLVQECGEIIKSNFFSVDLITRNDGVQRIVEIGDGQVSDIVGWSPSRFAEIWQEPANKTLLVPS